MPCKYVFLIKKLSLVIALSRTVLVSQSLQLFAAPRTVAHQSPLSMEFSRQEYWSGLPFPSPRLSGTGPLYNYSRQFKERYKSFSWVCWVWIAFCSEQSTCQSGRFGGGIFCSTSTYRVNKTLRWRKDDRVQLLREESELKVQKRKKSGCKKN